MHAGALRTRRAGGQAHHELAPPARAVRELGDKETGGRTALPIFREIMLRVYRQQLAGPVPEFPYRIERRIDEYLARQAALRTDALDARPPGRAEADDSLQGIRDPYVTKVQ